MNSPIKRAEINSSIGLVDCSQFWRTIMPIRPFDFGVGRISDFGSYPAEFTLSMAAAVESWRSKASASQLLSIVVRDHAMAASHPESAGRSWRQTCEDCESLLLFGSFPVGTVIDAWLPLLKVSSTWLLKSVVDSSAGSARVCYRSRPQGPSLRPSLVSI